MGLKKVRNLCSFGDNLIDKKVYRTVCYRCFRPEKSCLCSEIKSFPTSTRFVILMHPKEARKQKVGTGRISSLLLENSEIIVGINFTENVKVNRYLFSDGHQCFVLYPGTDSHNLSDKRADMSYLESKKINVIFVLDGTWPCVKKMMKESINLHKIDRISFNPTRESLFSIKHQPSKVCLSTIEAIYFTIDALIENHIEKLTIEHERLITILKKLVAYQKEKASDPKVQGYRKIPYKEQNERKLAIRWKKRRIYFDN